jgi:pilus assembly protein CpaE
MKPIVLVACSPDLQQRIVAAAGDGAQRLRRWSDPAVRRGTVSGLLTCDPAVVVLGEDLGEEDALATAAEIDASGRGISVVLVAERKIGILEGALVAGVRAVVPPDASERELHTALESALAASDRREDAVAAGAAPEPSAPRSKGRIITITSPKGGAGKTVIASNLAVALAQQAPRRVVLVDLDLQFGDISYALSLSPRYNIRDAAVSGAMDATSLKVFLSAHSTPLYTLCAPEDPAGGDDVTPEASAEILRVLAGEFEYVVIDTGAGLNEHTLAALDLSTDAVLISDPDVPSIRHLSKVVATLDRLQMHDTRRHFVLNRADARIGIRISEVLSGFGLRTDLEIPVCRDVGISLSQGEPIVLSNNKSPMAKKIGNLAEQILESEPAARPSGTSGLERSA